jgi:hypothetical protein
VLIPFDWESRDIDNSAVSVYGRSIDTEVQPHEELPPEEPAEYEPGVTATSPEGHVVTLTAAQFEVGAYFEFLYGWGVAPGIDLGALGAYTKVPTATGAVYRQDYERGISLGNLGGEPAEVVLEHRYLDLAGKIHTSITVPPRSVRILIKDD